MATETKKWTVLVWIAGDNNLDEFGLKDIDEMKRVGSNDHMDIAVQFDRAGDTHTRRYHLHRDTSLDDDLVEDVGETDTGDPAVATEFFTWGIRRFPSEHVLAVLWNHGSGIDEADVYARSGSRGIAHRVVAGPVKRALFATTVEEALGSRAIAYDDTSRDFLDNAELRKVLEDVKADTGRAIDVLGFDACLMSMIELAYELRDVADYSVGSEQTEPGNGWPYDRVLGPLAERPDTTPRELAAVTVQQYVESYQGGGEAVTLAAFDLSRADAVKDAVDGLAGALIDALRTPDGVAAISSAVRHAQRFEMRDFADLGDFCARLDGVDGGVADAAQRVQDALNGGQGLVVQSGYDGDGVAGATGAAVYLPVVGDVTVAYDKLAFASDTRWNQFLTAFKDA